MEVDEQIQFMLSKMDWIVSIYFIEEALTKNGITFTKADLVSTLDALERGGFIEKVGDRTFVNKLSPRYMMLSRYKKKGNIDNKKCY